MREPLEHRLPRDVPWLPLIDALTWARFRHACSLGELLSEGSSGRIQRELYDMLEPTWRELADHATVGRLTIRGKRDGEHHELQLRVDDLRNCRHIACTRLNDPGRKSWFDSVENRSRLVVRVERHPDTWEGAWDRFGDAPGHDYYDLVVNRAELMVQYPAETPSVRRLKFVASSRERAAVWLPTLLDSNEPKSITKREILDLLTSKFSLPKTQAELVWDKATENKPEWRKPGRPTKRVRAKSSATKISESFSAAPPA